MPKRLIPACLYGRCSQQGALRGYCADHVQYGSVSAQGYDYEWRTRIRPDYLRRHPVCMDCGEPSTEPDHKVSIRQARAEGWTTAQIHADSNLEPRCKSCHAKKTACTQRQIPRPAEQPLAKGSTSFIPEVVC